MLAGLYYLDCRFADCLDAETGHDRPVELCRLFAIASMIREEWLYPRYIDLDRTAADDLVAIMDLMRVIAREVERSTPSETRATEAWLRQWRRLWRDHAALERRPAGLLDRLKDLPHRQRCEDDLKQRLDGLDSLPTVPRPEPVSLEQVRGRLQPASLAQEGFRMESPRLGSF